MEEIALRKEIEAKKKREGKWEEPKLTPKQKEALNAQLEKESGIRAKLSEIKENLLPNLTLLYSSLKGCPKAFATLIPAPKFLPALYKVMQCPLFTEIMDSLFMELRFAVMENEDESLAQSILANIMLIIRDNGSKNKDLMSSLLSKIHKSTCDDPSISCPFTTPGFHLSFRLIKEAIWLLKEDHEMVSKGLVILNEHSGLEGADFDESGLLNIDELHPKYLPRKDMLSLLIDLLIYNSSQTAVQVLISVCKSASGKPGLAQVTNPELEILFNATKHENQCVRDAALRGLDAVEDCVPTEENELYPTFVQRLWVGKCDPVPENQMLCENLWDKHDLEPYHGLYEDVILDVVYPVSSPLRTAAAVALGTIHKPCGQNKAKIDLKLTQNRP